jgi:hypothetical protein
VPECDAEECCAVPCLGCAQYSLIFANGPSDRLA